MLTLNNVNVGYGSVNVLWDVSFTINKGEIITIIGPNGAGKTTIVKTIMGLLRPTKGTVEFIDHHIHNEPTHKIVKDGIALVPEGRELFPRMSVYENLQLGAYTLQEREDTMQWVFNLFPRLEERKKQSAGTLSGGEQQMLAMGRGLMSMPSLLMLDEPSLGLAPLLVSTIFKIIQDINTKGTSILLIEQNVYNALNLSNRGYVLENGQIAMSGEGKELLENPHIRKTYLGL